MALGFGRDLIEGGAERLWPDAVSVPRDHTLSSMSSAKKSVGVGNTAEEDNRVGQECHLHFPKLQNRWGEWRVEV